MKINSKHSSTLAQIIIFMFFFYLVPLRAETIGLFFPSPESKGMASIAGVQTSDKFEIFASKNTMLRIVSKAHKKSNFVYDSGCLAAISVYSSPESAPESALKYVVNNQAVEVPAELKQLRENEVVIKMSSRDHILHAQRLMPAAASHGGNSPPPPPPTGYFSFSTNDKSAKEPEECSMSFCMGSQEGLKSVSFKCGDDELTLSTDTGVNVGLSLNSTSVQIGPVTVKSKN